MNIHNSEALEDLQDARAELARYRRMLGLLLGATITGLLLFLLSGLLIAFTVHGGVVATVLIAGTVIALTCGTGFIVRVVVANGTGTDYRDRVTSSRHPADRVRVMERAYNRTLMDGSH